eukprot:scaffold655_cov69-Phaeocystis_antarctica.AAC.3
MLSRSRRSVHAWRAGPLRSDPAAYAAMSSLLTSCSRGKRVLREEVVELRDATRPGARDVSIRKGCVRPTWLEHTEGRELPAVPDRRVAYVARGGPAADDRVVVPTEWPAALHAVRLGVRHHRPALRTGPACIETRTEVATEQCRLRHEFEAAEGRIEREVEGATTPMHARVARSGLAKADAVVVNGAPDVCHERDHRKKKQVGFAIGGTPFLITRQAGWRILTVRACEPEVGDAEPPSLVDHKLKLRAAPGPLPIGPPNIGVSDSVREEPRQDRVDLLTPIGRHGGGIDCLPHR